MGRIAGVEVLNLLCGALIWLTLTVAGALPTSLYLWNCNNYQLVVEGLVLDQCKCLKEFNCNKMLVQDEFNQWAALPYLCKIAVCTRETSFNLNLNLTSLNLSANLLDSGMVLAILSLRKLSSLSLLYTPMDDIAFPHFALTTYVEILQLVWETHSFGKNLSNNVNFTSKRVHYLHAQFQMSDCSILNNERYKFCPKLFSCCTDTQICNRIVWSKVRKCDTIPWIKLHEKHL